ncbi:MAG: serine/threonine-protein kinase [Myxococcota bacterium]
MTPERWALVSEVFLEALEHTGGARASFLAARCGDDVGLRSEVESLLASDASAGAFLDTPPLASKPRAAGDRIGAWELEALLGHGGMGEVWLASRADGAYRQRAALKLIRPRFDDGALARRFVAERQILATLTHPHIARLLDGGTTPEGAPWFAMEYVEGEPLDAWCRARPLTLRARVELFLRVCDAVSEAHRHLVVHRDLKPANVLVTRDGTPRLLDFGIARLLTGDAGTLTHTDGVALTPAWASPEQIRGEPVTTASDVFSLGVILFELLTTRRPWGEASTPEATLRAVLDDEPPPTGLEVDVDAVVRKALEKDVARRYPSVEAFAHDLSRWLAGHPVSARAPSVSQRVWKAVARNRALTALGAAVFLSLTGGLVATSWQARIAQQRLEAVRALANTLIFEVHDAVLYVPGATEARTIITRKAVAYLDEVARDTRDPALRREVAAGYQKVAEALNYSSAANLGDA